MEPKSGGKKNKILIIVLAILVVAMVGLIIGLVFANLNTTQPKSAYDNFVEVVEGSNLADASELDICTKARSFRDNIENKLAENMDYSLDDALTEFDTTLDVINDRTKLCLAIEYSEFIVENEADINRAIDAMLKAEDLATYEDMRYYSTLVDLYKTTEDQSQYEYYTNILDQNIKRLEDEEEVPDNEE